MADPRVYAELDEGALSAATAALDRGLLVAFPTDTVYGVAARPELAAGTAALFAAKERSRDLSLPVLVADGGDVRSLAVVEDRAALLAERFWPGPLTLVLPRAERSRGWDLGTELETIALRIPDHAVALRVLRRAGPLATTSANRSGELTPADCEGVRSVLGDTVAVYLCAGPAPGGVASTVLDLTGPETRVVREGALSVSEVLGVL